MRTTKSCDVTLHILFPAHYRKVLKSPPLLETKTLELVQCVEHVTIEISYSRATIEDLEAVITSPATMKDGFKTVSSQEESTYHDDTPTSIATANFSDGSYVGEILEKTDFVTYRMSYMSPKFISTGDYNEHKRRYWYWSSKEDIFDKNTSCMLNLKPVISVATPPSTKRFYIFACYNAELLEITANSVFDVM